MIQCICCNASEFLIVTRPVINRAIPPLHDHMDTLVFVCELREREIEADRGREKEARVRPRSLDAHSGGTIKSKLKE